MRAVSFITSPWKTMARRLSPTSPVMTGPAWNARAQPMGNAEVAVEILGRPRERLLDLEEAGERASVFPRTPSK